MLQEVARAADHAKKLCVRKTHCHYHQHWQVYNSYYSSYCSIFFRKSMACTELTLAMMLIHAESNMLS